MSARGSAMAKSKAWEVTDDWQSDPGNVKAFALAVGIAVKVVPNAGHSLPKEYVGILLDRWTKTLIYGFLAGSYGCSNLVQNSVRMTSRRSARGISRAGRQIRYTLCYTPKLSH